MQIGNSPPTVARAAFLSRQPHATFCGSRRWVTAVGDPVLTPCLRVGRCLPHAKKANKQWVWIAMDKQTRQIIAFHVGDRSHDSAQQLWANLPAVYREQATFYTDQYAVYKGVIGRSYEFGDRAKPNKASKRPLTQASLRCKRWLKPSSLQRIPTPLNRC